MDASRDTSAEQKRLRDIERVRHTALELRMALAECSQLDPMTAAMLDITTTAIVEQRKTDAVRFSLAEAWARYDDPVNQNDGLRRNDRAQIERLFYEAMTVTRLHALESSTNDLRNALIILGTIGSPDYDADDTAATRNAVGKIITDVLTKLEKLVRRDPPPIITDVQPVVLKQGDT